MFVDGDALDDAGWIRAVVDCPVPVTEVWA